MVKKRIYIGEADGNAVYYDYEQNIPLSAEKSRLLNTQKTGKTWKYVGIILGVFFVLRGIGLLIPEANPFTGRYTASTMMCLGLLWLIECLFLSRITYQALYKNVKIAQPTSKKMLAKAISSNNLWNIFSNKRITLSKKIGMAILIVVIVGLTVVFFPMLYIVNKQGGLLGAQIGSEIIPISLLGILMYISVLLLWINNPLRWLNVVEKYQKKKIKNGEKNGK